MKASLKPYSPTLYSELPLLEDNEFLPHKAPEAVTRIGGVLAGASLNGIVGISLLHRHFDLNPEESLLRRCTPTQVIARPATASVQRFPCNWKFVTTDGEIEIYPIEFIECSKQTQDLLNNSDRVEANLRVLTMIGAILQEYDLMNCIGLGLLFPNESTNNDLVPIERTDEIERVSVIERSRRSPESIETLWSFDQTSTTAWICRAACYCHAGCKKKHLS